MKGREGKESEWKQRREWERKGRREWKKGRKGMKGGDRR